MTTQIPEPYLLILCLFSGVGVVALAAIAVHFGVKVFRAAWKGVTQRYITQTIERRTQERDAALKLRHDLAEFNIRGAAETMLAAEGFKDWKVLFDYDSSVTFCHDTKKAIVVGARSLEPVLALSGVCSAVAHITTGAKLSKTATTYTLVWFVEYCRLLERHNIPGRPSNVSSTRAAQLAWTRYGDKLVEAANRILAEDGHKP